MRKSAFLSLVVVQNKSFNQSVSPAKMILLAFRFVSKYTLRKQICLTWSRITRVAFRHSDVISIFDEHHVQTLHSDHFQN